MIHIVFQEADAVTLKSAMDLDAGLFGEVIEIKDDYTAGPLHNLHNSEGYQMRKSWWQNILQHSPYEHNLSLVDDRLTVHQLRKKLEENEHLEVWIWLAQNAHDVCGYFWFITQLQPFLKNFSLLHLHNLPFINEQGALFYPAYLHSIPPKEFKKAKRLARPIGHEEALSDINEWNKLSEENAVFRTLEGSKKIVSKNENFYDAAIITQLAHEPQKLLKIMNQFYSKNQFRISDVLFVWRIKQLAAQGNILWQGEWEKGWKDIFVSLPAAAITLEEK